MSKINEWDPVLPNKAEVSKSPDRAGSAPNLVDTIYGRLKSMKSSPPSAVHFYRGEGLQWIRVGFDGNKPLKPSAVKDVGQVIESCIAHSGPLFFHALRPFDMLFFLEGGDPKAVGMPPRSYGTPLGEVLHSWGVKPSGASQKAQSRSARPPAEQAPAIGKKKSGTLRVR
jgi:hypothetical protein